MFASPTDWQSAFDIVLEVYTLQALPPDLRPPAIARIAGYVAPGGCLLVICRGRDGGDDPGHMPWPLTREELGLFRDHGVREMRFEDCIEGDGSSTRRFRVKYGKVPVPDGSSPAGTEHRAQDCR